MYVDMFGELWYLVRVILVMQAFLNFDVKIAWQAR